MRRLSWKRGVAVGATANMIVGVAEPVEKAILGKTPPYHPSAIADTIIRRTGSEVADLTRSALTLALRWGHGSALGIAWAAARPWLPRSRLVAGVVFGAALFGVQRTALPLTRVTPPLQEWTREERIALAIHSFLWAVAAAAVDGRGRHAG
jgi:hypothetical protein